MITLIASKNYWEKEKSLYRAEITELRNFRSPMALEEIQYREMLLDVISSRLITLQSYEVNGLNRISAGERLTDQGR